MTSHPNRGADPYRAGRTPRPEEVLAARKAVDMTQTEAARLVHCSLRAWQEWEAGNRRMHPATWELFFRKAKLPRPDVPGPPDEDIV